MLQDTNYCLDCWNDFQSVEEKALYCDSCSKQRRERAPMPPLTQHRSSDTTNDDNDRLLTLPLRRDRDRFQGRCCVRSRKRRGPVSPTSDLDAPQAPFTSPGRLNRVAPAFNKVWLCDGFKTKESISRWCEDVGQYSLRDLADATGHPDPDPSEYLVLDILKPTPQLKSTPSRPRLSSFRHSYPNIHSAVQPNLPCKPGFMPCLPKAPSILQSNEEVLVTSHNIQNMQLPQRQTLTTGRPRAHTTSECKDGLGSRGFVDSTSVSYLQAILHSTAHTSKRSAKATRVNQVLFLVNQFLHPNFNVPSLPSSPTSGGGKLGLRVTSETDTLDSTNWSFPWQYPEIQFHHSQLCRDTPPTNPSSQMLETASDAISDLALSPNCFMQEDAGKQDQEDTLYDLVGTLTQRVHDELRLPPRRIWAGNNQREQRFPRQSEFTEMDNYSSDCQQNDDETGRPTVYGNSRGRSRRQKPVAVPMTTS